jgi:hypothetical protein
MLLHNAGQAAAKDFCGLKIYVKMKRQKLALHHGIINYKGTKVKCCHLKKLPVKELATGVHQSL